PEDANTVLDEGEVIRGRLAPGVLAQLGLDAEAVNNLKHTIANTRAVTERLNAITAAFETDAAPTSRSLRGIVEDVRAVTARFEGPEGWSADVDRIMEHGGVFAQRLGPATERFDELVS